MIKKIFSSFVRSMPQCTVRLVNQLTAFILFSILSLSLIFSGCSNSVIINTEDSPHIILGTWCPFIGTKNNEYVDMKTVFKELTQAGFNQAVVDLPNNEFRNWILKRAETNNIKLVVIPPMNFNIDNPDTLKKFLGKLFQSPEFSGLYIMDEPSAKDFEKLARIKKVSESVLPDGKFDLACLFPNYASPEQLGADSYEKYVSKYIEIVKPKLLCYDHYPITNAVRNSSGTGTKDLFGFLSNLSIIRKAAYKAGIPFWNVIQSWGYINVKPAPNIYEYRWMMNMTLAMGGDGVIAFPFRNCYKEGEGPEKWKDAPITLDGQPTFEYDVVKQCNSEIRAFDKAFSQFRNVGVILYNPKNYFSEALTGDYIKTKYSPLKSISGAGSIVIGCMDKNGQKGLYVANASFKNGADIKLNLNKKHVYEIWGKSGMELHISGNNLTVKLDKGEAKFIAFAK